MKDRLLQWADDQTDLDVVAKFVLYKLAQFADADCCGWAAVAVLARSVNVSERTVQYRLRALEEAGLIARTDRLHRVSGSTRSVPIYQLAPEVEGLGAARSMGANPAPIETHGCKIGGSMGAAACTRKEPTEPTSESSEEELSPDAGARAQTPFDLVQMVYPSTGLKRTNWPLAADGWVEAAREVGEARLLAAVTAYAADPDLRKGDHGAPGLHRWLTERRYLAFLPPASGGAMGAGVKAVWAGPDALRAAFVAAHGERAAASYLDRSGWDEAGRRVLAATSIGADWLGRNASAWLKEHGLRVERAQERALKERA